MTHSLINNIERQCKFNSFDLSIGNCNYGSVSSMDRPISMHTLFNMVGWRIFRWADSLAGAPTKAASRIKNWRANHKAARLARDAFMQLAWQDDRILCDTGVTREEVDQAVAMPVHVNAAVVLSRNRANRAGSACTYEINNQIDIGENCKTYFHP